MSPEMTAAAQFYKTKYSVKDKFLKTDSETQSGCKNKNLKQNANFSPNLKSTNSSLKQSPGGNSNHKLMSLSPQRSRSNMNGRIVCMEKIRIESDVKLPKNSDISCRKGKRCKQIIY